MRELLEIHVTTCDWFGHGANEYAVYGKHIYTLYTPFSASFDALISIDHCILNLRSVTGVLGVFILYLGLIL